MLYYYYKMSIYYNKSIWDNDFLKILNLEKKPYYIYEIKNRFKNLNFTLTSNNFKNLIIKKGIDFRLLFCKNNLTNIIKKFIISEDDTNILKIYTYDYGDKIEELTI